MMKSKITKRHPKTQSGSILVYGLVILAVGTALIAASLEVVGARSKYIGTAEEAIKRRIALRNGDFIIKQYFLNNILTKNAADAQTVDLPDGWGSLNFGGWSGSAFDEGVSSSATTRNDFNPGAGGGYSLDAEVTLGWGTDPTNVQLKRYEVHARSPLLGGRNLVVFQPTTQSFAPQVDQQWRSLDTTSIKDLPSSPTPALSMISAYAETGDPEGYAVTDFGGTAQPVLNFAFPPGTTGESETGGLGFDGTLNVVNPTYDSGRDNSINNSLLARVVAANGVIVDGGTSSSQTGVTSDGAGTVTIDVDEPFLTNVQVGPNVTTLRLQGQATAGDSAADALAPLLIVVDEAIDSLETVEMIDQNNRRLVLAIKKPVAANILDNRVWMSWPTSTVANPAEWRLNVIAENTPLRAFSVAQDAIVTGGVMTDSPLLQATSSTAGGRVFLQTETSPGDLEEILPKEAWIESYSIYDNL